jgi:S1-C subfamily serine protease
VLAIFVIGLTFCSYLIPKTSASFWDLLFLKKSQNALSQLPQNTTEPYQSGSSIEQAVVSVVQKVSPSVVSIIETKNVPIVEKYYIDPFNEFFGNPFGSPFEFQIPQYRQQGTQKQEVGGGSGFIISSDGLIVTNKHVVVDTESEYTVFTNDGKKYSAKVLARDPLQDLAVIKINASNLVPVMLGNSDGVKVGQFAITIGNALGEFRNTVSFGVVSGIRRNLSAGGENVQEVLDEVIQTDAAINPGNSGGPLLNLKGEVIGINTAMAQGAENIGFAIPINKAKHDITEGTTSGKIVYPFLGVRYIEINDDLQQQKGLSVNCGALIGPGSQGESAIVSGSPAQKAGLRSGDIILEVQGEKLGLDNSLSKIIQKYNPGDTVMLKILRGKQEMNLTVTLGEKSS